MSAFSAQPAKSTFPRCMRCHRPVEKLVIFPDPQDSDKFTVEFQCHGETVMQEIPSSLLGGEQGLGSYIAFSDYTSGLMPR